MSQGSETGSGRAGRYQSGSTAKRDGFRIPGHYASPDELATGVATGNAGKPLDRNVRPLRRFIRSPREDTAKARQATSRRKGRLDTFPFSPGGLKRCHGAAALAFQCGAPSTRAFSAATESDEGLQTAESPACSIHATSPAPTGADTDVESRSFRWRESRRTRKAALFQIYARGALLQHVRTTTLQQRGGRSTCEIDTEPSLDAVPDWVLSELRSEGHEPTTGGRR